MNYKLKKQKKLGNHILIGDKDCNLSDPDAHKNDIFEKIKNANYHDFEDSVYRMKLTYDEIIDILDKTNFHHKEQGISYHQEYM